MTCLSWTAAGSIDTRKTDSPLMVATATVIGDVVKQVAGENLRVRVLILASSDPHFFEATPRDITAVSDASLLFINGSRLEGSLENELTSVIDDNALLILTATNIISSLQTLGIALMLAMPISPAAADPV